LRYTLLEFQLHNEGKKTAYLSLLIIPIVLLFGSSVYGGWKNKVALNQVKASEYIMKLRRGVNPSKLERPTLRRGTKAKANAANREICLSMLQKRKKEN
jgi:hypothetical protein